ncbi:hypothetical protein F443_19922 [Phytophthora nicotianae P1569]|uniref:Uncharacterized protein n=1 Tax=Phytophthora nicotianae P1569 TaxID=1317065 RepID=V9E374_PHYNI|nr:hypothetical protein F443_19922 [Phytophthora nicotianae P1569]
MESASPRKQQRLHNNKLLKSNLALTRPLKTGFVVAQGGLSKMPDLKSPPETRQKYYLENPDGGFPLEEYPTVFRDGRTDRSRYPRMICADVERPQVLQNSVHGAQDRANMPIDLSVSEQLRGFERQRKELLRAVFDAETTALAFATNQKDIHLVISRSAALVDIWEVKSR